MVLIYCTLEIGLEFFTFISIKRMLLIISASTLLSFILLIGVDSITVSKTVH